jgi:type I restriction enzyme M protein
MADVRAAILGHAEFAAFRAAVTRRFDDWRRGAAAKLAAFDRDGHPKALIADLSESLLAAFRDAPLVDAYAVYQHLMDYWAEAMQDDAYLVGADGWAAKTTRVVETDKKGRSRDKGWTCDLIPKSFIVSRYFTGEQARLETLQAELDAATSGLAELEEEHGGEEGFFGSLDRIAKAEVSARLKEIESDADAADEAAALRRWLELSEQESALKRSVKEQDARLDTFAYDKYATLTVTEVKSLVIDDKWMARLLSDVHGELERVSQALTGRVRELAERYETPLPKLVDDVAALSARVDDHLRKMGASWR